LQVVWSRRWLCQSTHSAVANSKSSSSSRGLSVGPCPSCIVRSPIRRVRCHRIILPIEDWFGLRPRIMPVNRLIEADLSDSRCLAISRLTGNLRSCRPSSARRPRRVDRCSEWRYTVIHGRSDVPDFQPLIPCADSHLESVEREVSRHRARRSPTDDAAREDVND
jgi:hypothetical protein